MAVRVPLVCLAAGLLLAATHGVSGGDEIRRSDAPRLADLVREAATQKISEDISKKASLTIESRTFTSRAEALAWLIS